MSQAGAYRFSWISPDQPNGLDTSKDWAPGGQWKDGGAPKLVMQLSLARPTAAGAPVRDGLRFRVVVYDLDLYLGRGRGRALGDSAALFKGDGTSPWIALPPKVREHVLEGGAAADAAKPGTGVLLFASAVMHLRGPKEVEALERVCGSGWNPYGVEVVGKAVSATHELGIAYELGLWVDRVCWDAAKQAYVPPPAGAPRPYHGLLGTIRYTVDDYEREPETKRKLVVRLVAAEDATDGGAIPLGTAFVTSTNPKNHLAGVETRPVVVDHASQRRYLKGPPGAVGPVVVTGFPARIDRAIRPDLTGYWEQLPKGVDSESNFVTPAYLSLSQAGGALVGWYTPLSKIAEFSRPSPAFHPSRGVLRGPRAPGADGRIRITWVEVDDAGVSFEATPGAADDPLRRDPLRIQGSFHQDPFTGGNVAYHDDAHITVIRTGARAVIRVQLRMFTPNERVLEADFVRQTPRTQLPWVALRQLATGFLLEGTPAQRDALRDAVLQTEVQPMPLDMFDEVAEHVSRQALQPIVDHFTRDSANNLDAFQQASAALERAIGRFVTDARYHPVVVRRLHHFATMTPITSGPPGGEKDTKTALEWLQLMLQKQLEPLLKDDVTKPADQQRGPAQLLEEVLDRPKSRGFRLAEIHAGSLYTYALKFTTLKKVESDGLKKSDPDRDTSGGLKLSGEAFALEIRATGPDGRAPDGWKTPEIYEGLLASVGVGWSLDFKIMKGDGGNSEEGGGGAVDCTLRSFVPLKPKDFHLATFAVTAAQYPGGFSTPLGGNKASGALFQVRVSPAGVPPFTLYSFVEELYVPEGPKLPEIKPEQWLGGPEAIQKALKDQVEDAKALRMKVTLGAISETVGFLRWRDRGPPLKLRLPTLKTPVVDTQEAPADITSDDLRVFFQVGKHDVLPQARLELEYRLAAYRRLLEHPGFVSAVGYTSPEWSARINDKDQRQVALSQDRARAVVSVITDAVGGPGGGILHPHRDAPVERGLGASGSLLVGGLLDPDAPVAALVCDGTFTDERTGVSGPCRQYASEAVLLRAQELEGVPVAGRCPRCGNDGTLRAVPLDEFKARVQADMARWPEWRRVDVVVNGVLIVRLGAPDAPTTAP